MRSIYPKYLKLFTGIIISQLAFLFSSIEANEKPNIVFILADDLGYGDLGCYGHPYAKTPALDRLAKEGTRFAQFYVTGVTCNPSRTGLMTGVFPARFQKYAADYGFGDRITITELLKKKGYRTGHFGKWHIGPNDQNGIYGIDTVKVIGKSKNKEAGRDDDLFSEAITFIKENSKSPFYINIWGHATHFPVNTSQVLVEEFENVVVDREDFSQTMQHKFDECLQIDGKLDQSMKQYLGDVLQIDRNVGRVLKVLDELGLRNNTIVVFSSDHGPAPIVVANKGVREFSKNMLGYAGEFRGGKHQQYEGGTRVPFIVRWPGKIKSGVVDATNICSFIDWLPTLCSITGIEKIPGEVDGEDISDIWFGGKRKRSKPLFWKTSSHKSSPAIRDGQWKLHLNLRKGKRVELYDLSKDLDESQNLATAYPEVVSQLRKKLNEWTSTLPKSYLKRKDKRR